MRDFWAYTEQGQGQRPSEHKRRIKKPFVVFHARERIPTEFSDWQTSIALVSPALWAEWRLRQWFHSNFLCSSNFANLYMFMFFLHPFSLYIVLPLAAYRQFIGNIPLMSVQHVNTPAYTLECNSTAGWRTIRKRNEMWTIRNDSKHDIKHTKDDWN